MPQLPSGRHVGLSHGRALAMVDNYRIDFMMMLQQQHPEKNGILQFVNVIYFDPTNDLPSSDKPTWLSFIFPSHFGFRVHATRWQGRPGLR